ncbi:MAG TPA: PAS domain-containing protein [Tepidiformaceae bacterium]
MRASSGPSDTNSSPDAVRALADLLDASPALAWLVDASGHVTLANRRFEAFEPAPGTVGSLPAAIHPGDAAAWDEAEKRALAAFEPVEVDVRLLCTDGEHRWTRLSLVPRVVEGEIAGYAGSGIDIHRERLLEDGVSQSEARWHALVEELPLMIGRTDPRGRLTYVSPAFQAYAGRPVEEIMADPHGYIHPDDVEGFRDVLRESLEPGQHVHTEYRVRRADGVYRWHTALASPIRDAEGRITSWVGALIDIHDRREAEEALKASREQYQSLIDSMPAFFWRTNRNGRPIFMNEHYLHYTGLSIEDSIAGGWLEAIHPDDRERSSAAWWAAHAAGEPYECEHRLRRHDGVYRWHLSRGAPGRRIGDTIVEWNFTSIDIEVRHQSEQAIRRSESLFRALAGASPGLLWVALADGTPASAEILTAGASPHRDEAPAPAPAELLDAIHPADREQFVEGWRRAIEQRQGCDSEFRLRRPDGSYRLMHRRAVPVFDREGRLEYWVGTSVDITEERATEEAIREAIAVKDEFLGLVSHEMRSPLATVLGLADVLRRRSHEMSADDRRETIADIAENTVRLQTIMDDMFTLARLDRFQVETEPVMVHRLVNRVLTRDTRSPDFHYALEVEGEIPPVDANPTWVEQIVENLLSNAEKYSRPGAEISIHVECDGGDEVVVRVLDRGVGIEPEDAEKIFEPFFRTRQAPLYARGSGLGLSVCRRLVELQRGVISARPREGGGTEMRFTLPIASGDAD